MESNAKPIEQDEITQAFLSAVVNNCSHLINEKRLDYFEITFELEGRKFKLSLTDNTNEFYLLKDN